jgi:hypothetical protein
VALLGWAAAALQCQARDVAIGWPATLKKQRLALVANNSRFLILPWEHRRNLASRLLALNAKRLCADWQRSYGHPLLLAETFVDAARFAGTCYKAAGWREVGLTRGFARRGPCYVEHGQAKRVFLYPLQSDALRRLAAPGPVPELKGKVVRMNLSAQQAADLLDCLLQLPDPRKARGIRHCKVSVLALAICAVLSGAFSYVAIAEWGRRCSQSMLRRLRCRKNPRTGRFEPPSEPTIRRILQSIDVEAVDRALGGWLAGLAPAGEAIAIDGKTLRGARGPHGAGVHLLTAFLPRQGVSLAQRQVPVHSNEIPEAGLLLKPLELQGKVVTADALHTQEKLARFLVEQKKAHYCLTVKDNQPTLKQDIADLGLKESFPPTA